MQEKPKKSSDRITDYVEELLTRQKSWERNRKEKILFHIIHILNRRSHTYVYGDRVSSDIKNSHKNFLGQGIFHILRFGLYIYFPSFVFPRFLIFELGAPPSLYLHLLYAPIIPVLSFRCQREISASRFINRDSNCAKSTLNVAQ